MTFNKILIPALSGLFAMVAIPSFAADVAQKPEGLQPQIQTSEIPGTLVIRVELDEDGNESNAEIFTLNRQVSVTDEATAKSAAEEAERGNAIALDDQKNATENCGPGPGRWNYGVRVGGYGGVYGYGYNNYYGYGAYNRAYYPSYGYRYGGYNYPYYNNGYRYNAYPYNYYYYNYSYPRRPYHH